MGLTTLLIFLLSSSGLTIIVTKSYIFEPVRELFNVANAYHVSTLKEKLFAKVHKLLSCPLCFGFWAGLVMNALLFNTDWELYIALGFASSIFSFLIYSVVSV
jgi:hypothetical protein